MTVSIYSTGELTNDLTRMKMILLCKDLKPTEYIWEILDQPVGQ